MLDAPLPDFNSIDPPLSDVDNPADNDMFPAAPPVPAPAESLVLCPTFSDIEPAVPPVLVPDCKFILPVFPSGAAPVLKLK